MKTTTDRFPEPFDPWFATSPTSSPSPDPAVAPLHWHALTTPSRERMGGLMFFVTSQMPGATRRDIGVLAGRVRQVLRARHERTAEVTSRPLQIDLAPLYVEDEKERARWRQIERELSTPELNNSFLIRDSVEKLIDAGGILNTLRARRADLDQQIARLEKLQPNGDGALKDLGE